MYIVIEGIDTAGKSTQLDILQKMYPNAVFTKDNNSKLLTTEGSKILGGRIDLTKIKLTVKNKMNIVADKAFFEFGTTPLKDKSQVVRLTSNLKLNYYQLQAGRFDFRL